MQTDKTIFKRTPGSPELIEKTAYPLAAEGKIPGFKVGGSWRFRRDEIEGWIDKKVTGKEAK